MSRIGNLLCVLGVVIGAIFGGGAWARTGRPAPTASPSGASSAPGTSGFGAISGVPPGPPAAAPPEAKPALDTLLKPRSITKVTEDLDIVTNSEWHDDDFAFVNAMLIRVPFALTWPRVVDWSLYPKMSSAIKKFEYNPLTRLIEVIGDTHGLYMHSWMSVDQRYTDVVKFTIVRGDMLGFKINIYLWDRESRRTLAVARGELPGAKQMLPTFVALIFKPVSEIVLGVASKNFRSYIEEDYQKRK